ncbi:crossover junction endodeoxyribonuclease RuvC [Flavisolibacter nicotianae]|uniref:crossover junction endodeoxyribonuclease RuvC n=1 Tax=Flavisolibacter nicotianae TaxID=2364882 RepID=UPI000EADAFE3|nr:crossover junction endodeoxyribonuclease RuvC [Flavisolibacter nicotianae]
MQKPLTILGIDPGTLFMGYSVIEVVADRITIREMDVLKLTSSKDNYYRLQKIHQKVTQLMNAFNPDEFAIEAPFYGKNVQSMLKLGRAQGVAIAAAMEKSVPITEYSPKKVKQSITGNGNADKEQVWKMLQQITGLPEKPAQFDATDALAVAICHHYSSKIPGLKMVSKPLARKKSKASWEQFVSANGHRITT